MRTKPILVVGVGAFLSVGLLRAPADAVAQTAPPPRADATARPATFQFGGLVVDNDKSTPLGGVSVQLLAGTQPEAKTSHAGEFSFTYVGEVTPELRARLSRDGFQSIIVPISPQTPTAALATFRMTALDPIDDAVQAAAAASDCITGMPKIEQIGSTALARKGPHLQRAVNALTNISAGGGTYSELERAVATRCLDRVRLDAPQKNCTGLGNTLLAELAHERAVLGANKSGEDRDLLEVGSALRCQRRTKYLVVQKCENGCPAGAGNAPGIAVGDVVVRIGGSPVQTLEEWQTAASSARGPHIRIETRQNDGNGPRLAEIPSSEVGRLVLVPATLRDLRFLRKQIP
ncbi:MAG: hypothetical protein KF819_37885 [Labilithrix sp.]|nr:hypothetical protein [Labilithrix sp.]